MGEVFQIETPLEMVVVYDGPRGERGLKGDPGPQGDPGDSLRMRGSWASGGLYCPNDAVVAESSAAAGIQSLFVQVAGVPCSESTVEPRMDPARWSEIGAVDLSNVTGAIWTVHQTAHGFEHVGTPVGYDGASGRYVKAEARVKEYIGFGLIREIQDADTFVVQTTGELPNIAPEVIVESGGVVPGAIYYVSTAPGMLTRVEPSDPSAYSNPILVGISGSVGVAVPWRPDLIGTRLVPTSMLKFYYSIASDGVTVISGADDNGNTLKYFDPGQETCNVYVDGVLQRYGVDYTATDGTSIVFTSALPNPSFVEIHTYKDNPALVAPTQARKLDSIEGAFDGTATEFHLTAGGQEIDVTAAETVGVWLDGIQQEPYVDYDVRMDPNPIGGPDQAILVLYAAPEAGTNFWGLVGVPYS